MKVKGKYSESTIMYAIFLAVGLVAAVVVFLVVLNITGSSVKDVPLPDVLTETQTQAPAATTTPKAAEDQGYEPDEDIANEMKDAAASLLSNDYTVLRLYYTRGLKHKDEPYGNEPEDGYYTVDSDKYTSIDQIEAIVDSTFTPEFAEEIKTNPLGNGAVYKTRDDGSLGIQANFSAMVYDLSWDNPKFKIKPVSDTECVVDVTLHEKDSGNAKHVEGEMIKTASGWRFKSIVF